LFTFKRRQPSFHPFTFSPLKGVSHLFTFSLLKAFSPLPVSELMRGAAGASASLSALRPALFPEKCSTFAPR
ncbi:MAG: hypothetical protein ACFNVK_08115, partial [Prevotella sp.]